MSVAGTAGQAGAVTAGQTGAAQLSVQAVLNPLSKAAQRMAPVLEWLRSSFDASVKVKHPITALAVTANVTATVVVVSVLDWC